jgi:hypothetical protein
MKYFFPLVFLCLSYACHTEQPAKSIENHASVCKPTKATASIEIGVKGMVCQMGCGGSIRKALKETCAVEKVDVAYQDSLEEQVIKVYYSHTKIAPSQLLKVLSGINNKQFTVRQIGKPALL